MMVWIRCISEASTKNLLGIYFTLNVKVTKKSFDDKSEIEYLNSIIYWNEPYKVNIDLIYKEIVPTPKRFLKRVLVIT